jgi:hypothetical protein
LLDEDRSAQNAEDGDRSADPATKARTALELRRADHRRFIELFDFGMSLEVLEAQTLSAREEVVVLEEFARGRWRDRVDRKLELQTVVGIGICMSVGDSRGRRRVLVRRRNGGRF